MLKTAVATLLALLFLSSLSFSQDGHFDASINGGGLFTRQTTGNGVTQGATSGGAYFGTVRIRVRPRHSLAINFGQGRNSQTYQAGDNFHVLDTITEFTGAYVFNPWPKSRFDPFFLGGAGILKFNPRSTWVFFPPVNSMPNNVEVNLNAATQTQVAFVYGLGVDYRLPIVPRIAFRVQYRGFLYSNPDFKVDQNSGSVQSFFTGTKGHIAEPSVGIVFRF